MLSHTDVRQARDGLHVARPFEVLLHALAHAAQRWADECTFRN